MFSKEAKVIKIFENIITKWNKETYILYSLNDNMQDKEVITSFSNKFNCKLLILKKGERYFHTKEQLLCYKAWINNIID